MTSPSTSTASTKAARTDKPNQTHLVKRFPKPPTSSSASTEVAGGLWLVANPDQTYLVKRFPKPPTSSSASTEVAGGLWLVANPNHPYLVKLLS